MKIHASSIQGQGVGEQDDKGFTLIEILIAIVLVGILSAVAVVGISNLVSKGGTSACQASADAAKAGTAVYFASNNAYPTTIAQMVTGGQMTLPTGVSTNTGISASPATPTGVAIGMQTTGASWYLTMSAPLVAGGAPTFACT